MSDRDWFVPLTDDAGARVLAFPHAGGGCAQFADLAARFGPGVALWSANLPGRQARLDEPPVTDLDRLVAELAHRLVPVAGDAFSLFGFCGGALLALLVARELRDRGGPVPRELVVASSEAPDIAHRPRGVTRLPSELLWRRLVAEGGVPPALGDRPRLRAVAEPAVRADFGMLERYRYHPAPPLPCPVTVCFGTGDPAPRGAWLGWRRQSTAPLRMRPLPGGHWLLDEAGDALAEVLAESFGDALAPPAGVAPAAGPEPADGPDPAAPTGAGLESQLVLIWREVLGRPTLGRDANFFLHGGTSLKAIRLAEVASVRCGVSVNLGMVFRAPTPEALAGLLGGGG